MRKPLIALAALVLAFTLGCEEQPRGPIGPGGGAQSPLNQQSKVRTLQNILKEDPENYNALVRLGNIYMDTEQWSQAIEHYMRSLKIKPDVPNVIVDLGTCQRRIGRPDLAIKAYREALKLDPKHAYAHMNLGIVLAYDMGEIQAAVDAFEKFLDVAPGNENVPAIREEVKKLSSML